MIYYSNAEIVVHHITALIGDEASTWRIGRRLAEPIPVDELLRVQELVYYPCEWETAKQVYDYMVDEYEMKQDHWWSANSGTLIYVYKIAST